ncbi:MAG TPA: gas vesicle protein [Solirubrobacteraceae bacterium]
MTASTTTLERRERDGLAAGEVTVLDLVDRLLGAGIVIHGDVTLAAADIDLVHLALSLVVGSVDAVGVDRRGPLRPREAER